MNRIARLLDRAVGSLSAAAATVSCVSILLIAVGVTFNAVSRYAFNKPYMFVDEYAQYLLVVTFYLGVGYTLRAGKHVMVEMLVGRLGLIVRLSLGMAVSIVSLGALAIMCYYAWTGFLSTQRAGIVSLTPMQTPLALPFLAVAVGMTIFVLEMIVTIVNDAVALGQRTRAGQLAE